MENDSLFVGCDLLLKNRSELTMNGVQNVLGFDDNGVTLGCDGGRVYIDGENLRIENLSKENKEVLIIGRIDSISFEEESKTAGVFKKLFK